MATHYDNIPNMNIVVSNDQNAVSESDNSVFNSDFNCWIEIIVKSCKSIKC